MGEIVTFYSCKGGVGRSMALANVAVLLAQWGHKVLMIDWDLEAPGLELFFAKYLDRESLAKQRGVIDILGSDFETPVQAKERFWWEDAPVELRMNGIIGSLRLLTAGRRDADYYQNVTNLDIRRLYAERDGGHFLEQIRDRWKRDYDFILIDSRTGVTDIGGICTVQMPDVLILLFTATEQAFRGGLEIAHRAAAARQKLPIERLRVPVVPVPSRVDTQREFDLSQKWLDRFAADTASFFAEWLPTSIRRREILEVTKLLYVPYFSFGEKLPVLDQGTTDPAGLGYVYANLAALIAHSLQGVEQLIADRGDFVRSAFAAQGTADERGIMILHSRHDGAWARRLEAALQLTRKEGGIELWSEERLVAGHDWYPEMQTALRRTGVLGVLVSPSFLASAFVGYQEIAHVLADEAKRGLRIVPIIIDSAPWQAVPWLAKRQVLPHAGVPWSAGDKNAIASKAATIATELHYLLEVSAIPSRLRGPEHRHLSPTGDNGGEEGCRFDVFLSYAARDKTTARRLAEALRDRGLRVWFDQWHLVPGELWQEALEDAVAGAGAAVILVGEGGMGSWQETEKQLILKQHIKRRRPVIPVILPGAPSEPELPLFLRDRTGVDLREGLREDGLDQLVWGITGRLPP